MNIIITGASRGVGYETAKLLSAHHRVMAISRGAEKIRLPGVISIAFDFSKTPGQSEKASIKKYLLPKIKKHFQTVDVLINNAATLINKPFSKITRKEFEKVYSVNLFSIMELTQTLIPYLTSSSQEDSKSHVVNIASMGGIQGSLKFPGLAAYSSSKGALIALTECLAEEYKEKKISFNAIAFGAIQTEMLAEAFPGFKAPLRADQAAKFVAEFALTGHTYFNGKILQMALTTP
jgi:3-oxoacyl-[acyl-carrier protein] reductase